jgi:hypothetical protein
LRKKPEESQVSSFLDAALIYHIAELDLLPFANVELKELVAALFEINRGHNHQVDVATQVDQVLLRKVVDLIFKEV